MGSRYGVRHPGGLCGSSTGGASRDAHRHVFVLYGVGLYASGFSVVPSTYRFPEHLGLAVLIGDSGHALLTVINDLLDFSKVEAGKLELEQLDVDLRDTVEDVARLLAVPAPAKGLEVTAQIDPRLPDFAKGDAGRIPQVLLNLGGNAVKFTRQGEIAIEIKVLESDATGTLRNTKEITTPQAA